MWFKIKNQQVEIIVLAKPNAKQTKLLAIRDDALHIALHAKPQDGEANQELIAYLAKCFSIPKKQIVLQSGERSKHKRLMLPLNKVLQDWLDDTTLIT